MQRQVSFTMWRSLLFLDSPLGTGKETVEDTAKTASRYVDLIAARLTSRDQLSALAKNSRVPVINCK